MHTLKISLKTTYLIFFILFFYAFALHGQNGSTGRDDGLISEDGVKIDCVVDQIHELNMATDPLYRAKFEEQNNQIYKIIQQQIKKRAAQQELQHKNNPQAPCITGPDVDVLTIPLVVNIVHLSTEPNPGDGPSNPTDAQINQGIQDLNDALRNIGVYAPHGHGANDGTNADAALLESVDVEIQFCLAKRDINGNASSGIYRIESDTYSDLDLDTEITAMKTYVENEVGVGLFPSSDYANAWLLNELCRGASCSVAGFAGPSTGVLNESAYWGTTQNNSKVHIHEFGHYLNIWHTWQVPSGQIACQNDDCLLDGDYVCDTPPDNSSSSVSCGSALNTCTTDLDSGPFTVDQDDMYENYMDYGYQSCQNTFTQGQKDRMRASLFSRQSLIDSKGCIDPTMTEAGIESISYPLGSVCGTTFSPIVDINNNGNSAITSLQFSVAIDGGGATTETQSVSIASGADLAVTLNPATIAGTGSHNIFIQILQINGSAVDTYTRNNYYCQTFIYNLPTALDYCEDAEDGTIDSDFVTYNPTDDGTFDVGTTTNCAGNNGSNAIRYYSKNGGTGTEDALLINLDLTGMTNASLEFDLAYKYTYTNRKTTLDVGVSTDCGINYTSEYNKTHTSLNTSTSAYDPDVDFVPASCDDWRKESIDLTAYVGSVVTIRFQLTLEASWGQNLYLDNICMTTCPSFSPPVAACAAESASPNSNLGIGRVLFDEIDVSSSYSATDNPSTGYMDYSGLCANAATVEVGETHTMTIHAVNDANATKKVKAWIDYDNDGVFETGELVLDVNGFTSSSPATASVTIPSSGVVLDTYLRMRVLMDFNSFTNPCLSPVYGQAEDYAILIENSAVLPIELLSFSGQQQEESILLRWKTASEENNDFFTLEHSLSGYNFKELAKIDGDGNAITSNDYRFVHLDPTVGTNYYRLSQTDFDGTTTIEDVIAINFNSDEIMAAVVPNPVRQNQINLQYISPIEAEVIVQIIDMTGEVLIQTTVSVSRGENNIQLPPEDWNAGVYYLRTFQEETIKSVRFVKVN